MATIAVVTRTRRLTAIVPTRGTSDGIAERSSPTPNHATKTPNAAPTSDNTRLSARSVRERSQREAPSAPRIASSRVRVVARISIRLARFTQAMSMTKVTAPSSSHIQVRTPRVSDSRSGSTLATRSVNHRGVLGGQSCGDLIHPRLRGRDRDAVAQPPDDLQVVAEGSAAHPVSRRGHVGHPHLRRRRRAHRVGEGPAASRRGFRNPRAGRATAASARPASRQTVAATSCS